MKSPWRRSALLASVLVCEIGFGGSDAGDKLLEGLYGKFAESFSAGQAFGKGRSFLLLANPGIGLKGTLIQDPQSLAKVFDQIPMPARQYKESGLTYSKVYSNILQQSKTTDRKDMKERNRFYAARNAIYDKLRPGFPTAKYTTYLKRLADYWRIMDTITSARVEQGVEPRPTAKEQQTLDAAMEKWRTEGCKEEIEKAFETLDGVYKWDVKLQFAELDIEFHQACSSWPTFTADPPATEWEADSGWIPWHWSPADVARAVPRTDVPLTDPGSSAGFTPTPDLSSSLSFTVRVKRVNIVRPWLDRGIFASRSWRFDDFSGFKLVSSGSLSDPMPGEMPLLVTGILLAKDLVIKAKWTEVDPFTGKPTAPPDHLGPFALPVAGGGGPGASSSTSKGDLNVTAPGLQIIGFFCEQISKSPNPDPELFR